MQFPDRSWSPAVVAVAATSRRWTVTRVSDHEAAAGDRRMLGLARRLRARLDTADTDLG